MLTIVVPGRELFDERTQEFYTIKECVLEMEHSLVSLSKWESKWNKAFLTKDDKTVEETLDYIKCMTLTENVDPLVYSCLTNENIQAINNYISAPMTATTIYDEKKPQGRGETITSELIYYWMVSLNIPFECQHWHLNRLITLVRVCNVKNAPPEKHSKAELAARTASLNAKRRAKAKGR